MSNASAAYICMRNSGVHSITFISRLMHSVIQNLEVKIYVV